MIAVTLVTLIMAAALLAKNNRSVAAYLLTGVSLIPLVATQPTIKAVFTWLALIGLAGMIVTIQRGLLSKGASQQGSANQSS